MFGKPSLMTRVAVGKLIGLVVGAAGFFMLPYFIPDIGWLPRWGILFWYVTFGGIIGLMGVMTYHPILKMPLPWWLRDPAVGAWLNFVLVFFAYDLMGQAMVSVFGADGLLSSPFWFAAEGAVVGFVIGFAANHFGGEGKDTVTEMMP
jgi:hypothetical protein